MRRVSVVLVVMLQGCAVASTTPEPVAAVAPPKPPEPIVIEKPVIVEKRVIVEKVKVVEKPVIVEKETVRIVEKPVIIEKRVPVPAEPKVIVVEKPAPAERPCVILSTPGIGGEKPPCVPRSPAPVIIVKKEERVVIVDKRSLPKSEPVPKSVKTVQRPRRKPPCPPGFDARTASEADLQCLPGIGPKKAREIVEQRAKQLAAGR